MYKYLVPVFLFLSNISYAGDVPAGIKSTLDTVVPGYDEAAVKPAPVPGVYAFVGQGRVLYISEDGRYIISGNIIDIKSQKNLTELAQSKLTRDILAGYDEKKMIVFTPEGETKHTITVFTDVDCPYCNMLHKEVPMLNEAGIKVRYLMYPRAGVGSPTYHKSVSTWCSQDQQTAIGVAKSGGIVDPASCENPVGEQLSLGELIGVTGTPTLVLESGKILPGYVPAKQLIKMLDAQAPG